MSTDIRQELERLKDLLKKELIARVENIDDMVELMKLYNSMFGIHNEAPLNKVQERKEDKEKPEKYKAYIYPTSYKQKIASILKIENKFLNINEISNLIKMLEPGLVFEEIKKGVSSAKSNLLKEEAIIKYVVGSSHKNSFYGSGSWIDENGNPKPEHMYNEDSLVVKEEVKI